MSVSVFAALSGCFLILVGLVLFSVPAAFIVLGVMLLTVGLLFDFEE